MKLIVAKNVSINTYRSFIDYVKTVYCSQKLSCRRTSVNHYYGLI